MVAFPDFPASSPCRLGLGHCSLLLVINLGPACTWLRRRFRELRSSPAPEGLSIRCRRGTGTSHPSMGFRACTAFEHGRKVCVEYCLPSIIVGFPERARHRVVPALQQRCSPVDRASLRRVSQKELGEQCLHTEPLRRDPRTRRCPRYIPGVGVCIQRIRATSSRGERGSARCIGWRDQSAGRARHRRVLEAERSASRSRLISQTCVVTAMAALPRCWTHRGSIHALVGGPSAVPAVVAEHVVPKLRSSLSASAWARDTTSTTQRTRRPSFQAAVARANASSSPQPGGARSAAHAPSPRAPVAWLHRDHRPGTLAVRRLEAARLRSSEAWRSCRVQGRRSASGRRRASRTSAVEAVHTRQ